MSAETMNVVLILIIAALACWALYERYRNGQPITPVTIANELHTVEPLANQILEVGKTAALAAEQVSRGNPLMTNDEKLTYAIDFVKNWLNTWFPEAKDVKDEDIIGAINAGVLVASQITHQINQSKVVADSSNIAGVTVNQVN
jgi:hypothetical protein